MFSPSRQGVVRGLWKQGRMEFRDGSFLRRPEGILKVAVWIAVIKVSGVPFR